jgi:hypothetical protein
VIVEVAGCRALFEDTNGPLSQGTSAALVYETEHSDPAFLWAQDGEVRVSFDPGSAGWRAGSDPDALLVREAQPRISAEPETGARLGELPA